MYKAVLDNQFGVADTLEKSPGTNERTHCTIKNN